MIVSFVHIQVVLAASIISKSGKGEFVENFQFTVSFVIDLFIGFTTFSNN